MLVPERVDTFFYYIQEREKVRQLKEAGAPQPWTEDPIIQTTRFTNIKREYDRTTKAFKAIYDRHADRPHEQILLNCAIYRYFGTLEFAQALGWQCHWEPSKVINLAAQRLETGHKVFTGAYVITNQGMKCPKQEAVAQFLTDFNAEIPKLLRIAKEMNSWQAVAEAMYSIKGFGGTGFMTKEVLLDAMLTPVLRNVSDRLTWSPCGPGARKGLNLLHGRDPKHSLTDKESLWEMQELTDMFVDRVPQLAGLEWGVTDTQFSLCECAKYIHIQQGGRAKRKYTPFETLQAKKNAPKHTDGKTILTKELMIRIYNEKVTTNKTNKELALLFGLKNDSDIHRAIHRAIKREYVDPEPYRKLQAPGRHYGDEGIREYTSKEQKPTAKRKTLF